MITIVDAVIEEIKSCSVRYSTMHRDIAENNKTFVTTS